MKDEDNKLCVAFLDAAVAADVAGKDVFAVVNAVANAFVKMNPTKINITLIIPHPCDYARMGFVFNNNYLSIKL